MEMEKAEEALSESITLRYGEPGLELNWDKIMDEMPQPQRMIIMVDLTKIIMVDFQKWWIGIEWDEILTIPMIAFQEIQTHTLTPWVAQQRYHSLEKKTKEVNFSFIKY